ncbi:hypothetical protein XELAEV_18001023mg [Xenopus laevis]|nr:hypothetical protein XELAEV_18001023mg [Xenopus laevis]
MRRKHMEKKQNCEPAGTLTPFLQKQTATEKLRKIQDGDTDSDLERASANNSPKNSHKQKPHVHKSTAADKLRRPGIAAKIQSRERRQSPVLLLACLHLLPPDTDWQ